MRRLVWLALVFAPGPPALASTALFHVDQKSNFNATSIESFGGRADTVTMPVKPDTSTTVVWLLDTMDDAARDEARASLLALFAQNRARHLRLALLRGDDVVVAGPFTSSPQLQRALEGVDRASANPASGVAVLDALRANVSKLGANWSSAVIVGRLPHVSDSVQSYAQALLARSFGEQRVRVFLLSSRDYDTAWNPLFASSGGGVVADLPSLAALMDEARQSFFQVTWTAPDPLAGFVAFSATVESADAVDSSDITPQEIGTVPDLVAAVNELPTLDQYDAMQRRLADAADWLKDPPTPANLQRISEVLLPAQKMNPIDPVVLKNEVALGEVTHDYPYALHAAKFLIQVRPTDGASFVMLGGASTLVSDFEGAEAALHRAQELKVPAPQLAESYSRIHLGRKDERGALPYLAQALALDDKRQDLWLVQAQTADHLHEAMLATQSFERGLALGGVHVSDSCSLVRLYVEQKEAMKAHTFALQIVQMLPSDVQVRREFAECLDVLKLNSESLAGWKSVLVAAPGAEDGHVRIAQLLLVTGDPKASEEAATSGLEIVPTSGALYIAKADAILAQNRVYEARQTLETGAAETKDVAVMTRFADEEELYGDRATDAYVQLVNVLAPGTPDRYHALERGFHLSLRDGKLKDAATFAAALKAEGHPEFALFLGETREVQNEGIIPGGIAGLSMIAHIKQGTTAERFFAEYTRELVKSVCVNNCMNDHFAAALQQYFATVREIEGFGKREGNTVSVVVSISNKDERSRAQTILKLLGLQLHTEKGQQRLDRGEKESQGKKQDILTALNIDEIGLGEALQAGKPFTFVMHDEYASIYPNASIWKSSFPKLDQSQFALMLLHNPAMARLYVGISTLDRLTLQALIGNSGLFFFQGHPADLLAQYGGSFALEGTRASVPGGASARAVWTQLAGANPDSPGQFYQTLLQQKSPALLAYFATLSHLDPQHQAFFTATLERAKRFYSLFSTLPEAQGLPSGVLRDSSFGELLSSVSLDHTGHVVFPGSPEVWAVAKGSNSDEHHVTKLMGKVSRAAAPDVEDELLLHLADTRYKSHAIKSTELDNFLAVARIDAHRTIPLDEQSALMLAQNYSEFASAYPYFTEITAIDAAGFRGFFSLIEGIAKEPLLEQELEMGQLHSMLEWVVLIRRRQIIDDAEAARLFTQICTRLASANDGESRTLTSTELVRNILHDCGSAHTGWDDTLRTCLLGASASSNDQRGKDFKLVLEDQKAPDLDELLSIVATLKAAVETAAGGRPEFIRLDARQMEATFPNIFLPKGVRVTSKEKEEIRVYEPSWIPKLLEEWNENAAKPSPNSKNVRKLAGELLKAMEPQVTLAMAAPVYAYFLRSTDRVISDDPLFLRKHRYFDFVVHEDKRSILRNSEFIANSDGLGSHMEGGFAQFAVASGFAAASGFKQGGLGGEAYIAEEIAAIRSAAWEQLRESDQRLLTLRILAAREWIVASAQDPALFAVLAEETSGLLSPTRRADLLNGLEERDWPQVWKSITLPDLFRLGSNYLRRYPSGQPASPVVVQLRIRAAADNGARLNVLGRIPNHALGCSHTHLVSDAPYEEYERLLQPTYMAERTAEFKLFLAYRADSLGVQPADLAGQAEKLAARAFRLSQMTDDHDWSSLLVAYAAIGNDDLRKALEP